MHRSGTSATARLMQRAGVDLGTRLLAPTLDNTLGYYEDVEFCDLNLALVAAGVGDDGQSHPDWAFADRIVPSRLAPLRPRAAKLMADRGEREHPWGFKDPRTAVLLDFYDDLAPDARYLFVYRAPWEVLTSLMSVQARPLHGRADVAVHAWTLYNARLLEFREQHPERTVLVHVDAVARRPEAVIRLVQAQAVTPKLDGAAAGDAFVGRLLLRSEVSSALAELLAADHPEAMEVYARLEAAADIASLEPAPSRGAPRVDIETRRGPLAVAAALVGAPADGVEDTTRVARPAADASPGEAADTAVGLLPDDLVAVLFDGQLRPEALAAAVTALQDDVELGAVLLAPGDVPQPPCAHDPLSTAEAGAGVVLRREAWLAPAGSRGRRRRPGTRRGRSRSRAPPGRCAPRGSRARSTTRTPPATTTRISDAACSRRIPRSRRGARWTSAGFRRRQARCGRGGAEGGRGRDARAARRDARGRRRRARAGSGCRARARHAAAGAVALDASLAPSSSAGGASGAVCGCAAARPEAQLTRRADAPRPRSCGRR